MSNKYNHKQVEEKWLQVWEEKGLFQGSVGSEGKQGKEIGKGQAVYGKESSSTTTTSDRLPIRPFSESVDAADDTADEKIISAESKIYLLFAFAYPSGQGLHVGHVESKTALDILARYYRMMGRQVFFPVGWDAFGLPAENYAIKTGVPPVETTKNAIDTFRRQIKRLGISYDWSSELATCHPGYYKWTQWLFLQLYNKGMAYKKPGTVNWCPNCMTVLANEQVIQLATSSQPSAISNEITTIQKTENDAENAESQELIAEGYTRGVCERCEAVVEQREMEQWYFRITDYTEELISGLEQVDWPEPTKRQQLEWIGKSEGIQITFEVADSDKTFDVFTTAPTNWGASFMVLAPEHKLVESLTTDEQRDEVAAYLNKIKSRSESDRKKSNEKTGVFTGSYAVNHVTGKNIPIWISDFVLADVGTGAIQACPGHDVRDFEFAKKFGLPIPRVVVGPDGDDSPIERSDQVIDKSMPGKMINSDFLDGMDYVDALQKTMDYFEEKGWGKRVVTYKLRDWLISRQRYWGAPIPIVYDPEGKAHPVREEHLPWMLPTDVEFRPTGESPLTSSRELADRTRKHVSKYYADLIAEKGWDKSGKDWTPEYDTMDTFVDSSWYFMRYLAARNETVFTDVEMVKKWLPVDMYMIGPEHIVLHLLYARFLTKLLRDEGYLGFDEPFAKMRHQGMILGPDGKKMSKSKGNVISPDEIVEQYGADTLRMYEMFMGPLDADKPWDPGSVKGVRRFLDRVWRLVVGDVQGKQGKQSKQSMQGGGDELRRELHRTVKKVSEDISELKFNTAIARMMEFINSWEEFTKNHESRIMNHAEVRMFVKLLAPFAPFVAEELWQRLIVGSMQGMQSKQGSQGILSNNQQNPLSLAGDRVLPLGKWESDYASVHEQDWPEWDEQMVQDDQIVIVVQVNGKTRSVLGVSSQQSTPKGGQAVVSKDEVITEVLKDEKVEKWLEGKEVVRTIWVEPKNGRQGLVNFVVK